MNFQLKDELKGYSIRCLLPQYEEVDGSTLGNKELESTLHGPQRSPWVPTERVAFIPPPFRRASDHRFQPFLSPWAPPCLLIRRVWVPYPENPPSSERPGTLSRRPRRQRQDSSLSYDSRKATPSMRRYSRLPPTTVWSAAGVCSFPSILECLFVPYTSRSRW